MNERIAELHKQAQKVVGYTDGGYYQLDPIVAKILDVPSGQLNDDIDAAFEKIRAKAWADYEARQAAK